ncbi:MAG TPA: hypothetical protein ENO08_04455, partial [Candidatus Eisenbacteria bacterium]|nr:hypothetical protein [Candidatus Eisenbacteria bacterium]
MKKTQKRLLIALCAILGIAAVLSAAVRIVLTKDVLMELVLPRLERAVRAEIAVEDIGVRFPFGFGVDIEGLTFEKTMPQGEVIAFEGDRVVARVSLLSLIKRKPVIERVDIDNGSLSAAGGTQQLDARIEGLRARLSMHPFEEGYRAAADLSAAGVVFALREKPPVDLGGITFEGEMTLDAALDSLHIDRGKAGWGDAAVFEVSGGIGDLKGSRRISLRLSSEGISIERLVERVLALVPARAAGEKERTLQAKILAGTLGLKADVSGSLARPSGISVSGTAAID